MWANINPPGGMNRAHQHPNSLWSGVYYVKAPKNSGHLKVDDPRNCASMIRPKQKKDNYHQDFIEKRIMKQ
jgi:uncharacterized protein (TIGR02466 family)